MAEAPTTLSAADRERLQRIDRLFAAGAASAEALIAELADPSWAVRRSVVAALGALGEAALPALLAVLRGKRDDETIIAATADALVASTGDVEAAVRPLLQERPAVVADVAQVLGRRQLPAAIPILVPLTRAADDNVAVAAIEALGRVGGRAAVEPLVEAVRSGNFFRVFPAIDVLGRSGDPRAVPPLADLLESRHYALEAARALGRTADRAAVAPLARLLRLPADADVRVAAVALADLAERFVRRYGTLGPIEKALADTVVDEVVVRRLARVIAGADAAEKVAIARVMGLLRDEAAVTVLATMLADPGDGVAAAAAEALGQVGRRFEDALAQAVRQGDSARRKLLLPLITQAAPEDVAVCLEDADPEVRAASCEALARIGNPALVDRLFQRLSDPHPGVVQAAVGAIQSLGSERTIRLALEAARAPEASIRRWGLRILAYFGSPDALEVCLASLNDPDPRVRDSAIFGLPFLSDPRARAALLEAARAPVPKTRAAAVRALGECPGDVRAQAALVRAISDPEPWVRYYACQALGRTVAETAVEAVARLIDDDAGQVRVAAVEALSHFKSTVASDALARAAASEDADVRRAALIGLGIARRPQALPLLLTSARSDEPATRLVALAALAGFEAPEATAALAAGASDPDEGVRNAAIGFLAGRAGAAVTRALVELVRRNPTVPRVHQALATPSADRAAGLLQALATADDELAPLLTSALARINRPDARAALREALRLPHLPARKAAAMTLASVGTREALAVLREAASQDPDPEVRRICAVVLS